MTAALPHPSPTLAKSRFTFLERVFFLILAVHFFYPFFYHPLDRLFSDFGRHWNNGESLFSPSFTRGLDPPAYQFYIYLVRTLAGDSRFGIALATGILCALLPWLWQQIALELGLPKKRALLCGICVGVVPSLFLMYSFFMNETLLLVLTSAGILISLKYWRQPTDRLLIWQTLVWTFAALCKLQALPMAMVFYGMSLWRGRPPLRKLAAAFALIAIIVVSAGLRNGISAGFFAPFGTPILNTIYSRSEARKLVVHIDKRVHYWFVSSAMMQLPLAPFSDWKTARQGSVHVRVETAHGQKDWEETLTQYPITVDGYMQNLKENFVFFFFGVAWPENVSPYKRINFYSRFIWFPLTLFVAIGALLAWRRLEREQKFLLLVTAFMIGGLLFQYNTLMEGRFRKPVEPLLIASAFLVAAGLRREARMEPPPTL